jgi:hypothetical protein
MATLANIRAALNGEIGVITDAETVPWSSAVRSTAIADAYAELWRQGVWKPLKQDLASVADQYVYALTAIRSLKRIEVIDSNGTVGTGLGRVEDDGAGGYQLLLSTPFIAGFTIRVWGWGAYVSAFATDAATDDLPAEYGRIPRLKAKAILYRQQLGLFARYGERQAIPAEMNLSIDQLLGVIAAAEREFTDECDRLSGLRPRVGRPRRAR